MSSFLVWKHIGMDLLNCYSDDSGTEDAEQCVENDEESRSAVGSSKKTELNSGGHSAIDFFGLNDDCEEEPEEPPSKKTKEYKIGSKGSDVQVEVPDSDFWKNFTPPDDLQEYSGILKKNKDQHLHPLEGKRERVQSFQQNCAQQTKRRHFNERGIHEQISHSGAQGSSFRTCHSQKSPSTNVEHTQRQLFYIHSKISPHLTKTSNIQNRYPQKIEREVDDYKETVNRVVWNNPPYCHLFLSASMDGSVRIWNIWTQLSPCVQSLCVHKRAVKDAVWSPDGRHVLSCSYDKTAKWIDVDKGSVLSTFGQSSFVTSCKVHPNDPHLSITGGQNVIHCWDNRHSQSPCRTYTYKDSFGQVQDLLFSRDGDIFFSAGDEISRDTADRNIMAWDFRSTSAISNQIYQERYSCTRLKLHPTSGHFLAQSHGNYIALFSVNKPFKMNKAKRFEGHKLSGYSIGFDISPDGSLVLSGDSSGQVFCYNFQTGRIIKKIQTGLDVVMDVSFNPVLSSTTAVCGWNGKIQVLS